MPTLTRSTVLLLLTALLAACGAAGGAASEAAAPEVSAAAPALEVEAWAHERSDLEPNERLNFGQLSNGMRYVWMDNGEPDERSYLRMHVNVGSTAELESEQGMAHFLEHMAFNGSQHYEAGRLITWFQEQGMEFGAHVNASTGFDETIYMLNLPDSGEDDLRDALTVFRDYAVGLDLAAEEVELEKGVIDGEQRERDSANFRLAIESLKLQFEGTRFANRIPIGVQDVRAAFTDRSVRAFYERWYRPDNMVLVLVGDLDGLDPVAIFEDTLGTIPAPTQPKTPLPEIGEPTFAHPFFAKYDTEVPTVNLTLGRVHGYEPEEPTSANIIKDVPLSLARAMLNTRFSELAKKPDATFLAASVGSNEAFNMIDGQSLSIVADPEKWEAALAFCEQELRRALEYGFQGPELDEVRANRLRSLSEAVDREATRSSAAFAGEIVGSVRGDYVVTDASTDRELLAPAYTAATVEAAHAAFVEAWGKGKLTLTAMGGLDLGADDEQLLRAALDASLAVAVEPPAVMEDVNFAYASSPEDAGAIASRSHIEDLDIHQIAFANGVLLNVKTTDFKENQVILSGRLGEGQLALDPDLAQIFFMAQFSGMGNIGMGEHSVDDMRRVTAGKQVGVNLAPGTDAFSISGGTTAEDLLLEFEIMAAYLSDPGWREDGMTQIRQFLPLIYQQMEHTAQGPMFQQFMPALHGGDPRFGMPAQEDVAGVSMGMIKAWAAPQLAEGPLEISVVGDIDVEQVVAAAARTLGALPARRERIEYPERLQVKALSGVKQTHTIDTQDERTAVQVFYPTTDGFDATTRRRLSMLSEIVADRVREKIREELGESYSPGASSNADDTYPGLGYLMISANAEPSRAQQVLEAALEIGEDLATNGVTDEELNRLREPQLKQVRDAQRQNGFWINALSESQSNANKLQEIRDLEQDYLEIVPEDLSNLARLYLGRDNASWAIVGPEPKADS